MFFSIRFQLFGPDAPNFSFTLDFGQAETGFSASPPLFPLRILPSERASSRGREQCPRILVTGCKVRRGTTRLSLILRRARAVRTSG